MRRPTHRINARWWKDRALEAPAMVMAGIFIAGSGLMSVTFGYRLGEPSGFALIFAAVALGIEAFVDLSIPLFWRRIGIAGRTVMIAFFAVCLAYKLEAAKRFSGENFGQRDAAIAKAAEGYGIAFARVEGLRKTIADNADARAASIIQAEIDGLLRDPKTEGCAGKTNGPVTATVCPKVDALRGELARAKTRDQAQTDLAPALTEWRLAAPASASATQDSLGPLQLALAALGLAVASWSSLMATLVMVIVEGGAIIVPALIGMAGDRQRPTMQPATQQPTAPIAGDVKDVGGGNVDAAFTGLRPETLKRGQQDVEDVTLFLSECTDRRRGETVQASQFFAAYREWKTLRGESALSIQRFGTLIARHAGVEKQRKADGVWYLGLTLRHPAHPRAGKAVRNLQLVEGGKTRRSRGGGHAAEG
jgi:hypothetical protein